MRSSIALGFLAAALAAGGCKKADDQQKPAAAVPAAKDPGATAPAPTAPAPTAADGIKLAEAPPKVGDKKTKFDDVTVNFTFEIQGKKIDAKSVEHKEETVEIVALDGKIPMKIKVSYAKMSAVQTMAGKDQPKPQPLDGKSYLVWSEGGAVKFSTADGGPVTPEEEKALQNKADDVGRVDPLDELLSAHLWKIGETYAFTDADLAKIAGATLPGKPVPKAMSFTLTAVDDKIATFDMTTKLVQGDGPENLTFEMKGVAKVERATSHGLEMKLSGPLSGTIKGMPTTGTVDGHTTYTYAP